jgi:large subunit ribosomal protein L15
MWFEGGQMPLFRRIPKHGFNNPLRTEYNTANVGRIQRLVDEGRIDAGEPVTPEVLEEVGAVRDAGRVKILGDGVLDDALEVSAHDFSGSAKEKIEEAGGSATIVGESE